MNDAYPWPAKAVKFRGRSFVLVGILTGVISPSILGRILTDRAKPDTPNPPVIPLISLKTIIDCVVG